jgi:hypothetical protein
VVKFTTRPLYPRGKAPGTHLIRGWVGPRAGLHDVEKILGPKGLELRPLGRPARNQSLYRLSYILIQFRMPTLRLQQLTKMLIFFMTRPSRLEQLQVTHRRLTPLSRIVRLLSLSAVKDRLNACHLKVALDVTSSKW